MMCDVYQNSFLTISADHAVDARGGCFRDRYSATVDAFKLHMKPLQSTWWVSVDERNLFQWVKDVPSSERAWIYQEQHLYVLFLPPERRGDRAPLILCSKISSLPVTFFIPSNYFGANQKSHRSRRVLHFTEHEVFWECRAAAPSFRSETYFRGSPLRRDFLGQTKLRMCDTSAGSISDNPFLMLAWDAACRDYSRRKLTYQTDKLPALSGLARHFGSRCREDRYVAGIWLSQLPRALFWTVPRDERPEGRPPPTESGVPSWSWMSCAAPVEPSKVEDSYYIADVATTLVDYQHKTADQYGEMAKAYLHVFGFVRRITSVMKEMNNDPGGDAYRVLSQLDESRKYRHLYVDWQLDRDIGYGADGFQQFGEAPDWFHGFAPVDYDCLFLAVSQEGPRDDRVLRALLLESAGEEGTFRRVGHIFFRGRCALKMRYQLRPGETDEHGAWERLWELVAPYWGEAETDVRGPTGPVPVDIQAGEPRALYEFDGHVADDASFLKLEPRVITLV